MSQPVTTVLESVLCSSAVQVVRMPSHHSCRARAFPAAASHLQSHIAHQHRHVRTVTVCSHQRKRNPFIDIQRDVLPDGKPNTPWRRLKLQIQQALSTQALIRLYTNNRHKNNVWRPIHSAGILMRVGALQYYRVLQNPVSDQQTSLHTLELLDYLGPDLADPKVLHVLDAARLSQVLVVLSTLHSKPELAVLDPLVREVMREGCKKVPKTKPDLLAELSAALVRLGWREKELWLAVVSAAKAMLLVQQQSLSLQEQHPHQPLVSQAAEGDVVAAVTQQGQNSDEEYESGWAEQEWEHRQKQQQEFMVEGFPSRQQQQQQWQRSHGIWQVDQQQLALASSTEFQWEEQQQLEQQQEWLEEQHWHDSGGQLQQHLEDADLSSMYDPWQMQQDQHLPQQQQQMLDLLEDDALDQQQFRVGSSSLFGPRWLSADFPKLAAALAAAAAMEDSTGPHKDTLNSSSDSSGGLSLRASVEEVMEMMGSAAIRVLVLLTPAELADLVEAYATVGLCHDELLHGIHNTLIDKIEYLTSSISGYRPMKQQQLVNDAAAEVAAAATAETDLAAVIRAAGSLSESGHADLALVAAVQKLLTHCLRSINSRDRSVSGQLDNALHLGGAAAAAAGVGAVQMVQLLQLLASSGCSNASVGPLARFVCSSIASSGLDALTPQQLQSAAKSLVELQQQPEAAAAAAVIGASAAARAAECGAEVLIEVLWGCVMLGCGSELLAELAVAFVDHQQSSTLPGRQQQQRRRQKGGAAPAAAGSKLAYLVDAGLEFQTKRHNGVELSSKSRAQLIWALQQLNRQDLLDRVLSGISATGPIALGANSSSIETSAPVF